MRSPNHEYLPAVDQLRGFAAVLILYYHCYHNLYSLLVAHHPFNFTDYPHTRNFLLASLIEGHTAVSLFLVISGFILTWGSLHRDMSYRLFFRNRALRILPLYLFVTMAGVYIYRDLFQFIAFVQTILPLGSLPGAAAIGVWSAVTWTVSIEMQLYLIFPVLQGWLRRAQIWQPVGVLVLATLVRLAGLALGANTLNLSYWTVLGRVDQFVLGALLAYWMQSRTMPRFLAWLWPVSVVAMMSALYAFHLRGGWPTNEPWRIYWPLAEALLWCFVLATYVAFAKLLPRIISRAFTFLGEISYSIYLTHFVVVAIFSDRGWNFNFPGRPTESILLSATFIMLPMVVAISWLTYNVVERPFLDLRKRYMAPSDSPIAAVPAEL